MGSVGVVSAGSPCFQARRRTSRYSPCSGRRTHPHSVMTQKYSHESLRVATLRGALCKTSASNNFLQHLLLANLKLSTAATSNPHEDIWMLWATLGCPWPKIFRNMRHTPEDHPVKTLLDELGRLRNQGCVAQETNWCEGGWCVHCVSPPSQVSGSGEFPGNSTRRMREECIHTCSSKLSKVPKQKEATDRKLSWTTVATCTQPSTLCVVPDLSHQQLGCSVKQQHILNMARRPCWRPKSSSKGSGAEGRRTSRSRAHSFTTR